MAISGRHGHGHGHGHVKKTSCEDDLIVTLRTQLALQSELCAQYEVDLRARDEVVDVLGRRLEGAEREGEKRRNVLKGWKKKVAELERACRCLEEEVDQSRQESMERSVMDEASGEALRMLHRQIAALEREKVDAEKREGALREEVGTLEVLVKDKTEDVQRLNEALWARDEKQQQQQQAASGEEKMAWDEERTELGMRVSRLEKEKAELEDRVNDACDQLKSKEDELGVLKTELEAQWKHTEAAGDKTDRLEKERETLLLERAALQVDVKALEERIDGLEMEWTDNENKRVELENQAQEVNYLFFIYFGL